MQLSGIAILPALAIAGAWGCSEKPASNSTSSPSQAVRSQAASDSHPPNSPDRLYLSKAQIDHAQASGTFDRPVKSLLRVPGHLQYGDYVWNDAGVPAGPTWVRIDLHSQLISAFRGGDEIGTAVIVYGGDNKQTPTGKLHILGKAEKHRSSLYDAEMPYTLRLTNDGVSIHGSNVRWGAASHGCVGVPIAFARRLFDAAHVGDEVVILPANRAS